MKKIKMTIYVSVVLWIAVFTQVFVNHVFKNNAQIIEAFANTDSKVVQSDIQVFAEYGDKYLTENDKKNMLDYIAKKINLKSDYNYQTKNTADKDIISISKQSLYANTNIQIISMHTLKEDNIRINKQYIVIDIEIYENINSAIKYKEIIEETLKEIKVAYYQTTMGFSGFYDGKISLDEMNKISNGLINNLEATIVSENREDTLFTIYAYTGLIDEYITTAGRKVNINIAITYNEETDKTEIYLATPIINTDF